MGHRPAARTINTRRYFHAHRQTCCPIEHPLWQFKPVPQCAAIQTAVQDAAGSLLDHLTDMNNTPEPRMPRIKDLALFNLMGVISPPCIICGVRIRRSGGEHRTRLTLANRRWRRTGRLTSGRGGAVNLWTVGCADPRLTAQARSPMDKPGKTQCVSSTLPTGRRLPTSFTAPPQQRGMNLIPGKVNPSAGHQS